MFLMFPSCTTPAAARYLAADRAQRQQSKCRGFATAELQWQANIPNECFGDTTNTKSSPTLQARSQNFPKWKLAVMASLLAWPFACQEHLPILVDLPTGAILHRNFKVFFNPFYECFKSLLMSQHSSMEQRPYKGHQRPCQ